MGLLQVCRYANAFCTSFSIVNAVFALSSVFGPLIGVSVCCLLLHRTIHVNIAYRVVSRIM